jgi:hypothetical protein
MPELVGIAEPDRVARVEREVVQHE